MAITSDNTLQLDGVNIKLTPFDDRAAAILAREFSTIPLNGKLPLTPYQQLKHKALLIVGGGKIRRAVPGCSARLLEYMHIDHIENDGCEDRRRRERRGVTFTGG